METLAAFFVSASSNELFPGNNPFPYAFASEGISERSMGFACPYVPDMSRGEVELLPTSSFGHFRKSPHRTVDSSGFPESSREKWGVESRVIDDDLLTRNDSKYVRHQVSKCWHFADH